MKKTLIATLILLSFSCKKNTVDSNPVGETVLIYPVIVMVKDLGVLPWGEAINACNALGTGWRLPTEEELRAIFANHDKIGLFVSSSYWSSTEYVIGTASTISYPNSIQANQNKLTSNYVRAVKTY